MEPAVNILLLQRFNPRSHEGNDAIYSFSFPIIFVSIHVPTRGTTAGIGIAQWTYNSFNPRSHEGNDKYYGKLDYLPWSFNPRSHEGNDLQSL